MYFSSFFKEEIKGGFFALLLSPQAVLPLRYGGEESPGNTGYPTSQNAEVFVPQGLITDSATENYTTTLRCGKGENAR